MKVSIFNIAADLAGITGSCTHLVHALLLTVALMLTGAVDLAISWNSKKTPG